MVTQLLAAEAIGHVAESGAGMLGGHGFVGAIAHGAGIGAGLVASAIRTAGLRSIDELVDEAMLNPELARKLLAKVPLDGNADAVRSLANRIRALSVTAPLTEETGSTEKPPASPIPQAIPQPMRTGAIEQRPVTLASVLKNGAEPSRPGQISRGVGRTNALATALAGRSAEVGPDTLPSGNKLRTSAVAAALMGTQHDFPSKHGRTVIV